MGINLALIWAIYQVNIGRIFGRIFGIGRYHFFPYRSYTNQKSPNKIIFLVPTIINIMILDFLVSLTYIMILDQDTNSTLLMKHVFGSMSINVNGMIANQISFRYSTCILSQFSNIPPVRVFLYSHWWLLITSESKKYSNW